MRYDKANSTIARATKTDDRPTKDGVLDKFRDFSQF
jgi:hypothetical protein